MNAKIVFLFFAHAVLMQAAFSQVIPSNAYDFSGSGFGSILNLANTNSVSSNNVLGANTIAAVSGNVATSPLIVTSISPIAPTGLAVASENTLEGILTVSGQLPFLSAVAFEGALPTSGSGVATCGCGNGQVGITGEGLPAGGAGFARY